jgi:hypothetical protein
VVTISTQRHIVCHDKTRARDMLQTRSRRSPIHRRRKPGALNADNAAMREAWCAEVRKKIKENLASGLSLLVNDVADDILIKVTKSIHSTKGTKWT